MNMRPGSRARHRAAEGEERNAGLPQVIDQGLAFTAVGMKTNVDRIAMIES